MCHVIKENKASAKVSFGYEESSKESGITTAVQENKYQNNCKQNIFYINSSNIVNVHSNTYLYIHLYMQAKIL